MDRWESLRQHIQRTYRVTVDDRVTYPSMDWHGLRFIADPSGADPGYVVAETRTARGREYVLVVAGIGLVNEVDLMAVTHFVSTQTLLRITTPGDGELNLQEIVPLDQVDATVLDEMVENVLGWAQTLKETHPRR